MAKGITIQELRTWRMSRGLTMEAAGAMIVVDGKAVDRATWHGWERGRKVPSDPYMFELERVTGVQPNSFYNRPRDRVHVPENDRRQIALIA